MSAVSTEEKSRPFLIEELQKGVSVPKIPQWRCMDIMIDVLSDPHLHLHAADGYNKKRSNCGIGWNRRSHDCERGR